MKPARPPAFCVSFQRFISFNNGCHACIRPIKPAVGGFMLLPPPFRASSPLHCASGQSNMHVDSDNTLRILLKWLPHNPPSCVLVYRARNTAIRLLPFLRIPGDAPWHP